MGWIKDLTTPPKTRREWIWFATGITSIAFAWFLATRSGRGFADPQPKTFDIKSSKPLGDVVKSLAPKFPGRQGDIDVGVGPTRRGIHEYDITATPSSTERRSASPRVHHTPSYTPAYPYYSGGGGSDDYCRQCMQICGGY